MPWTLKIALKHAGQRPDLGYLLTHNRGGGEAPFSERLAYLDLQNALRQADTGYYLHDPGEDALERENRLRTLGRSLYKLLDTDHLYLSEYLKRRPNDLVVILLDVTAGLGHLPWELLHDGRDFLIARPNPVIPIRSVDVEPRTRDQARHPLRLLFMACEPIDGPGVLNYQMEEAMIRDAAADGGAPFYLEYEPTGSLSELGRRLGFYDRGHFDVIHLTGHALRGDGRGLFLTEDRDGRTHRAFAADLHEVLWQSEPGLVFLSGCQTAEGGDLGAAPSLAEELATISAPIVVGWGRPVNDRAASEATAAFYQQLMLGRSPAIALARSYQELIKAGREHWHMLRMHVQGTDMPRPLTVAVAQMPLDQIWIGREHREIGASGLARVSLADFFGRRREIQRLDRMLNPLREFRRPGAVVHGVGGVGKTTLVANVLERITTTQEGRGNPVTYVSINVPLTREILLQELGTIPELGGVLGSAPPGSDLKGLLVRALRRMFRPVIIVLDEFEQRNITAGGPEAVPGPEAVRALSALIDALATVRGPHRIVITSRYLPKSPGVELLDDLALDVLPEHFQQARIDRLAVQGQVDARAVELARQMARDNPRLLTFLFDVARDSPETGEELLRQRFQQRRKEFYDKLAVDELIGRRDPQDAALLRAVAPFRIPVPAEVLARLAGPASWIAAPAVPDLARQEAVERAERLAGWHLLEYAERPGGADYRVPAVFEPVLTDPDPVAGHARCAAALAAHLGAFDEVNDPDLLDLPALAEVQRLATAGRGHRLVVRAAATRAAVAARRFRYAEAQQICRQAIDVVPHPLLFALLGNAQADEGDAQAARQSFEAALAGADGIPTRDRARVLSTVGFWSQFYDPPKTFALLTEALGLARASGDAFTQADCLRLIAGGWAQYGAPSHLRRAAELYEESLELFRTVRGGDLAQTIVQLDQVAFIAMAEGRFGAAQRMLDELAGRYTGPGEELPLSAIRVRLAGAYLGDSAFDAAEREARAALTLAREVGWGRGEFDALCQLGDIAAARHNAAGVQTESEHVLRAIAVMEEARTLAERIGWPTLIRVALGRLAQHLLVAGREAEARRLTVDLDALEAAEAVPPHERAARLVTEAETRLALDDHTAASAGARRALTLLVSSDHEMLETRARRVLAQIMDFTEAPAAELAPQLDRLEELYGRISPRELATVHLWRGRMHLREESPGQARHELERAAAGFAEAGSPADEAATHELFSGLSGISDEEKAHAIRLAARLRYQVPDHKAAAVALRELAPLLAYGQRRRTYEAVVLLAQASGARDVEGHGLNGLADLAFGFEEVELRARARQATLESEPLHLAVSTPLGELLDPDNGGTILDELAQQREELRRDHGIVLPSVRIYDTSDLGDGRSYRIHLWGQERVSGEIRGRGKNRRAKAAAAREVIADLIRMAVSEADRLDGPAPAFAPRTLTDEERHQIEEVLAEDNDPN
ncbi:CHAT domain-containing protein [Streptosporangium sp. NPDC005286]|uniref:CHAT domain-containing protein n=1 Tax=Streptosporangium sp. NPDC005286 TaxID=3154463 RepID=UPI0033AD0F73